MAVHIPKVLSGGQLLAVQTAVNDVEFVDGMRSAGASVRNVKKNREAGGSDAVARIDAVIQNALAANGQFQAATLPHRILPFIISSYVPGEAYGDHVDNPIMGANTPEPVRADLSMTLFLSEPADYAGGELLLDTDGIPVAWKLPAGDAVVYPTFSLHRVNPVTAGERLAAVTWIQSFVRLPEQRQILSDLSEVLGWMKQAIPDGATEHPEYRRLEKARSNLVRLWAEF
jgi:PKHD-type hydroxylase